MPQVALYYPTWGIDDPNFLFDSLLYWERLACIVPEVDFEPHARSDEHLAKPVDALHEAFVSGLAPTDAQREHVHKRVADLLDRPPPDWCRPEHLALRSTTRLSTEKLGGETTRLLRERGWTASTEGPMVAVSNAAASVVMSEFVQVMSSEDRPPVTSNTDGFRTLCNTLLWELHAPSGLVEGLGPPQDRDGDDATFVVARVSRLAHGQRTVTARDLKRLLKLRSDAGFDEMRASYCASVDAYLADLRQAKTEADQKLVHDSWEQRLRADRTALKRDLRSANLEGLIEKEGIVATLAGTALGGGATIAAGPVGLAIGLALAGAGIAKSTLSRRREAMEHHWSSWLFTTRRRTRLGLA